MATTTFREDFLGRDLVTPTVNAKDYLGRAVGGTTDAIGATLRRLGRANTTAYALGQELQFATGGSKYTVTVAGTTAASEPTPPAVGATVADGTATLLRTK